VLAGTGDLSQLLKLEDSEFIRVRIGISPVTPSGKIKKPSGEEAVEKHIIGPFKKPELDILKKVIKDAVEAIEIIIPKAKSAQWKDLINYFLLPSAKERAIFCSFGSNKVILNLYDLPSSRADRSFVFAAKF
jgi:hypothetical protein